MAHSNSLSIMSSVSSGAEVTRVPYYIASCLIDLLYIIKFHCFSCLVVCMFTCCRFYFIVMRTTPYIERLSVCQYGDAPLAHHMVVHQLSSVVMPEVYQNQFTRMLCASRLSRLGTAIRYHLLSLHRKHFEAFRRDRGIDVKLLVHDGDCSGGERLDDCR